MGSDRTLDQIISESIQNALAQQGHVNILVAGGSGVGKSTLINAVFQGELAETGSGRPVTKSTREITKEGIPLTLFDSRGLEAAKFDETLGELDILIKERNGERDAKRHIHVAWVCLLEGKRRVEESDSALVKLLSDRGIPVIGIITQSQQDNGFRQKVLELMPEVRNVVRVRAIQSVIDDGETVLKPFGLEKLIEVTSEVVPEAVRQALAAAQKVSVEVKKNQAQKIVVGAVTAAAAAGASPIPFSDAALLVPIQVGMFAGISSVFGMDVTKSTLATLTTTLLGSSGATLAGKAIVSNLFKLVPGIGSVAGAAISGSTAAALTLALGEAYIATLAELAKEDPDGTPEFSQVSERFKSKLGQSKEG